MNKDRLKELLSFTTIFVAWIIILHISFLALNDYNPLVINNITLLNDTFKRGDLLMYEIDYCKNMNISATVSKHFEDGLIYRLNTEESDVSVGCHKKIVALHIPDKLPTGRYRLCSSATYHVNKIRDVTVKYVTDEFEVVD